MATRARTGTFDREVRRVLSSFGTFGTGPSQQAALRPPRVTIHESFRQESVSHVCQVRQQLFQEVRRCVSSTTTDGNTTLERHSRSLDETAAVREKL